MPALLKILCVVALSLFFKPAQACEIAGDHIDLNPAHWYQITNTPFLAETENDYLWVYMSISGEDHVLPAWSVGGDAFEFIVPADYVNPWQDKSIDSFWLTDGEAGCELTNMSHGALEPNPVGLSVMAINIAGEYQTLAAEMGYPISEIKAVMEGQRKPPENEPVLQVIYGAMGFYGDYVRAVRSATPEEKQILQVMGAYLSAAQGVDTQNDKSEVNQALYDWHVEQHRANNSMQFYPMASSSWGQVPKLFFDEVSRVPETDFAHPKTAKHLSMQMRKQFRASIANKPNLSAKRDVAGTLLGLGSTLGTQAGGAGKGIGFAYARASEWLFMQAFTDKLVDALYPAEFVSIDAVGGPYELYTDTTPKNGTITAINVVTKSKGGISIAQMFADVVNQFFPYNKALGKVTGKVGGLAKSVAGPALKKIPPGVAKTLKLKLLSKNAISAKNAIEPAREMMEHVAKQLLAQRIGDKQTAGDFKSSTIKPFTFSPVNILERGYHQTNVEPRNIILFETDETSIKYAALSKGQTTIRFQTYPNKWGNQNIVGEQVVRVDADDLIIDPKVTSVIPGENISFLVMQRASGDKKPKKSDLVISFAEPGFSVRDINGPFMRGPADNRFAIFAIFVDTPKSLAQYPTAVEVSLRSNPNLSDQGRIGTGKISPERTCIDNGETEHFIYTDHLERPMPGVDWQIDGPGQMTSEGIYTAPDNIGTKSEVSIIALNSQNQNIIERKTYKLGCSCFWQANFGGKSYSGTKISAANISLGPVSNINIMTLDSASMMFALTGEGHILNPEYISTTIQDEDISYMSGLPVNMNIGKMFGNDSCQTAKTDIRTWSVENGRWLSGHVGGDMTTDKDLASGCVTLLKPYEFRFMLDLGENVNVTERVVEDIQSGKLSSGSVEFDNLLNAVSVPNSRVSACLSDQIARPEVTKPR